MSTRDHSNVRRISIAASGMMLWLGGTAIAQTVQVFDDAPTIEQLRSIMIPESRPRYGPDDRDPTARHGHFISSTSRYAGTSRSETDGTPTCSSEPPVMRAASSVPVQPVAPSSPPEATADAGEAVAFHINFAFNSNELPQSARAMIDMMAKLMKEAPEIKLRVEGHTDAVGSVDYNMSLSERRALSVAEYLVKQGIEPSRLILIGKGMAEPLTSNPTIRPIGACNSCGSPEPWGPYLVRIVFTALLLTLCRAAVDPGLAKVVRDTHAAPSNPAVEAGGYRLPHKPPVVVPYSLIGAIANEPRWLTDCDLWPWYGTGSFYPTTPELSVPGYSPPVFDARPIWHSNALISCVGFPLASLVLADLVIVATFQPEAGAGLGQNEDRHPSSQADAGR